MSVQIKPPAAIQEIGSRDVNEDFVYPQPGESDEQSRLFLVCDGLGGVDKGDVASRMVASEVGRYIQKLPSDQDLTEAQLARALGKAEEALSKHMQAVPSSMGMGTTLSLIHIGPSRVTLAWTGNSPIYFFEAEKKNLVRAADILFGQASTPVDTSLPYTPQTIHGKESPARLEVRYIPIEKLKAGDYFMLCTDGILEHVDEAAINLMLSSGQSPDSLIQETAKLCREGGTQDNYSCYLVQLDKVHVMAAAGEGEDTVSGGKRKSKIQAVQAGGELNAEVIEPVKTTSWVRPLIVGGVALLVFAWVFSVIRALNQKETKTYEEFVSDGESFMNQDDYDRAALSFDSAAMVAKNPGLQNRVMELAAQARSLHEESLYSMEELLGMGETAFAQQDYETAEEHYQQAEKAARREGAEIPLEARERMVFTNIKLGDLYYEGENSDLGKSLAYYKEALRLGEGNTELAANDDFTRANSRIPELETVLTTNTEVLAENQPAESPDPQTDSDQQSRSLTPNNPTPAPTTETRPSVPSAVRPQPSTPSITRSDPEVSNDATARTVSSTAKTGVGSASALEKGIRLFDKASKSGSNYEYKYSAINLEKAGSALDGKGAYMLAYLYHHGLGVDRDGQKALNYAGLSARKNWPSGHYLYAHLLLLRNNAVDSVTALKSLRLAANKEYEPAIVKAVPVGELRSYKLQGRKLQASSYQHLFMDATKPFNNVFANL